VQHGTELAHVLGKLSVASAKIHKHAAVGGTGIVFFGIPELGAVVGKAEHIVEQRLEPFGVRTVGVD
jgi:hypothetical protein